MRVGPKSEIRVREWSGCALRSKHQPIGTHISVLADASPVLHHRDGRRGRLCTSDTPVVAYNYQGQEAGDRFRGKRQKKQQATGKREQQWRT